VIAIATQEEVLAVLLRDAVLVWSIDEAWVGVGCGIADPLVLQFDDRLGAGRVKDVGWYVSSGSRANLVIEELARCDVRCANCHRRRTAQAGAWFRARVRIVDATMTVPGFESLADHLAKPLRLRETFQHARAEVWIRMLLRGHAERLPEQLSHVNWRRSVRLNQKARVAHVGQLPPCAAAGWPGVPFLSRSIRRIVAMAASAPESGRRSVPVIRFSSPELMVTAMLSPLETESRNCSAVESFMPVGSV
jgi:hypothetical protein